MRPDELCGQVVRALIERSGVDGGEIEDLTVGCAFPEGEQGMNIGRIAGVLAGLPRSVAGATVNRFCGSSMQAVHTAAGAIALDMGEAYIAACVESMTRISGREDAYEPHPLPCPAFGRPRPADASHCARQPDRRRFDLRTPRHF